MKKVGEVLKIFKKYLFNYVLYIFSSNEGGFVSSPLFQFMEKPHTNDDMRLHKSNIRMTLEYIRMTYG